MFSTQPISSSSILWNRPFTTTSRRRWTTLLRDRDGRRGFGRVVHSHLAQGQSSRSLAAFPLRRKLWREPAAQITHVATDLKLDGVLLLSMTGKPGDADMPYVVMYPSLAAIAAYQRTMAEKTHGRTPQEFFEDAARFARTEYVTALIRRRTAAGRQATHGREDVGHDRLTRGFHRLEKSANHEIDFVLNLLKARGLTIGQIDSRVTGAVSEFVGQQPPHDDPSMAGSKKGRSNSQIIQDYLTKDLAFPTVEISGLNSTSNAKCQFSITTTPSKSCPPDRRQPQDANGRHDACSGRVVSTDLATPSMAASTRSIIPAFRQIA